MGQTGYPAESNEFVLIERLKEGHKTAFETIYHQYRSQLKSFAYFELKDEGMAEDAVHDIFLKLWMKRQTLDPHQSIKGFLYTCLKNHLLNVIRTRKNELLKHRQVARLNPAAVYDPEQSFTTSEGMQMVQAYLSNFSEQKQTILRMSLFQGFSHEEIAHKLNLSVNTIKMYLSHSTRKIKSIIKEKL